jgi:hypothetical protein
VNILLTVSLVLLSFCWHSLVAGLISRQRDRSVLLALHAAVQDHLDWLLIFFGQPAASRLKLASVVTDDNISWKMRSPAAVRDAEQRMSAYFQAYEGSFLAVAIHPAGYSVNPITRKAGNNWLGIRAAIGGCQAF